MVGGRKAAALSGFNKVIQVTFQVAMRETDFFRILLISLPYII
jgi:hypothetical protein